VLGHGSRRDSLIEGASELNGWGGRGVLPNDEFRTPEHLVKQCLAVLEPMQQPSEHHTLSLLDPCAGTGAWFFRMAEQWPYAKIDRNEILEGTDFFQNHQDYDWIIGNPPFSNLTAWLQHSALLATKGIAYILPSHALNYNRIRMMESFGFYLAQIHVFENPKEWRLGYPHFFVVWRTNFLRARMISLGPPVGKQERLGMFLDGGE